MMTTGKQFMEKTKYKYLPESDQVKGLPQPPLADSFGPGDKLLDLPPVASLAPKSVDLTTAMVERVSVRQYSSEPLSLADLSYLLWVTQGVKYVSSRPATLRTVPSAGSRHPFETYMLVNNVTGLSPGLYQYAALSHQLVAIDSPEDISDKVTAALYGQAMVKHSAATFLWVAVAYRSAWRYGERSYRYMHLDAGHVCQNLYLAAEAVDSGCCAIAAFHDDMINALLGVDGEERFMIYAATVGKKRERKS